MSVCHICETPTPDDCPTCNLPTCATCFVPITQRNAGNPTPCEYCETVREVDQWVEHQREMKREKQAKAERVAQLKAARKMYHSPEEVAKRMEKEEQRKGMDRKVKQILWDAMPRFFIEGDV